jgi:hypothetical protein
MAYGPSAWIPSRPLSSSPKEQVGITRYLNASKASKAVIRYEPKNWLGEGAIVVESLPGLSNQTILQTGGDKKSFTSTAQREKALKTSSKSPKKTGSKTSIKSLKKTSPKTPPLEDSVPKKTPSLDSLPKKSQMTKKEMNAMLKAIYLNSLKSKSKGKATTQ